MWSTFYELEYIHLACKLMATIGCVCLIGFIFASNFDMDGQEE